MSSLKKYAILSTGILLACSYTVTAENSQSEISKEETQIKSDSNDANKVADRSEATGILNNSQQNSETEEAQKEKDKYVHEDVMSDMLSIGSYNSVVKSIQKNSKPKTISTAFNVIDFNGNIAIDEQSPISELVAIPDWDRYSGDSAKTIKGWSRWWKYLRMKEPIVMEWFNKLVIRIFPSNEIYRSIFVNGIYDPNLVVVLNNLLPKEGTLIDAGANMGYVSLLASCNLSENGKIYALEPSQRDFERLIDNVSINHLSKVISCHNIALSDKTGTAKLMIAVEERSALNTLGSAFSFKGVEKAKVEDVKTMSLDEFIINEGIEHVDVVKLDLEGSELKALQGAINTIQRYRPAVILGVNQNALKASGTSLDEIEQMLKTLHYRAYKIVSTPNFALEQVEDLKKSRAGVVFCLHESVVPPTLPQPEIKGFSDKIKDFFLN